MVSHFYTNKMDEADIIHATMLSTLLILSFTATLILYLMILLFRGFTHAHVLSQDASNRIIRYLKSRNSRIYE